MTLVFFFGMISGLEITLKMLFPQLYVCSNDKEKLAFLMYYAIGRVETIKFGI